METQRFCVYNLTRESLLGTEVAIVDSTVEPLKKLVEYLSVQLQAGLWLLPYRGIPSVPGLPPFDLVCLNEDHRVIQEVELFSTAGYVQLESESASALVLPAHTLHASQTQTGDQLMICFPQEMEVRLQRLSGRSSPAAFAHSTESPVGNPSVNAASAPSLLDERFRQQQLNDKEAAESEAGTRESLKTRLFRWLVPDRRRASRRPLPELVAYRWTGDAPQAHRIGDISDTGLYLLTEERWLPGTMITMTLQKANTSGDDPADSLAVQTRVVRWGSNGEGLDFVDSSLADVDPDENRHEGGTSKRVLKKFLQQV